MAKLPFWKIKREIKLVVNQIKSLPTQASEHFIQTRKNDAQATRSQTITTGEIPHGPIAAIYLIFPRDGILASHIDCLRQLREAGASTLVVSNLPLNDDMRATLQPHCAEILERDNFGYDFGGYRDAIIHLSGGFNDLDRLIICNDSSWFIETDESWFQNALARDVDYVGATSHFGVWPVKPDAYKTIDFTHDIHSRKFHFASYVLCVGKNIVRDPKFLKFWTSMKLSNEKSRVVSRGEMGFTKWIIKNGYSHSVTCPTASLPEDLQDLTTERLFEITERIVTQTDHKLQAVKDEVIAAYKAGQLTRKDLISFILATVSRVAMAYSMAEYSLKERHHHILKKSSTWLHEEASALTVDILKDIDCPQRDMVLSEITDIQMRSFGHNIKHVRAS